MPTLGQKKITLTIIIHAIDSLVENIIQNVYHIFNQTWKVQTEGPEQHAEFPLFHYIEGKIYISVYQIFISSGNYTRSNEEYL